MVNTYKGPDATILAGTASNVDVSNERLTSTGKLLGDSQALDSITMANGFSQYANALSSSLYGIDINQTPSPAQLTNEQYGLVFFTRPLLNLSYYNLTTDRVFAPMLTQNKMSVAAYTRAMLDPLNSKAECPLVDPYNPWIPLLSNTLQSLAGWQDPIISTFQSDEGLKKERWAMVDSTNKVYGVYELSATFRNVRGNFLYYFFHVWQTYMCLVYEGICDPYPQFIKNNMIDYQTRIYRLILDPTRTYVEDIISCNAAFPLVSPLGTRANYTQPDSQNSPVNRDVDIYNQTFQCQGANYMDPLQIYEFNRTTGMLNPNFQDPEKRVRFFRQLWPAEYKTFTYRAYPYIDPRTARLQWWVSNALHESIMGKVSYGSYNPQV